MNYVYIVRWLHRSTAEILTALWLSSSFSVTSSFTLPSNQPPSPTPNNFTTNSSSARRFVVQIIHSFIHVVCYICIRHGNFRLRRIIVQVRSIQHIFIALSASFFFVHLCIFSLTSLCLPPLSSLHRKGKASTATAGIAAPYPAAESASSFIEWHQQQQWRRRRAQSSVSAAVLGVTGPRSQQWWQ